MNNVAEKTMGRPPTLFEAVAVILCSAFLIGGSVLIWGTDVHIALTLSAVVAAVVSLFVLKYSWTVIEEGIVASIMMGMVAILILFTVGMLVGCWIISGVVPSMVYYGLNLLSPSVFFVATILISSIVSLATGSSWGTVGTIGIALMGISAGLGVPAPITAGFILSGAYFGDKMSPLSDTTNLAPAMAGTDIFQHIRAMCWTTIPSYVIVLVIGAVMGLGYSSGELDVNRIQAIQKLMATEFVISPIAILPPILVIGLAVCRKPALPSMIAGVLAGFALGMIRGVGFGEMLDVLQNGYTPVLTAKIVELGEDVSALNVLLAEKGLAQLSVESVREAADVLNGLFSRGGLQSLTWSNSLVLCALVFGGILDKCGFLEVILGVIMRRVRTAGGYVFAVSVACVFTNVFSADQYVGIVLPGRMFKNAFEQRGLHPRMLSRVLEDSGTLTSPLVPWSTCGAYQSKTLGVATIEYLPYAFLNYINPIVSIVMTYLGIGIAWRGKDGEPVVAKNQPAS